MVDVTLNLELPQTRGRRGGFMFYHRPYRLAGPLSVVVTPAQRVSALKFNAGNTVFGAEALFDVYG